MKKEFKWSRIYSLILSMVIYCLIVPFLNNKYFMTGMVPDTPENFFCYFMLPFIDLLLLFGILRRYINSRKVVNGRKENIRSREEYIQRLEREIKEKQELRDINNQKYEMDIPRSEEQKFLLLRYCYKKTSMVHIAEPLFGNGEFYDAMSCRHYYVDERNEVVYKAYTAEQWDDGNVKEDMQIREVVLGYLDRTSQDERQNLCEQYKAKLNKERAQEVIRVQSMSDKEYYTWRMKNFKY